MPHVEEMLFYLKNNRIRSGIISNEYCGHGYATEVARALIEFVIETL